MSVPASAIAPEFCSPLLVTTGLDPVVHAEVQLREAIGDPIELPVRMDCRIKSGNDEDEAKEKRKRNADRRVHQPPRLTGAARALVSFPSPACGGGLGGGTLACRRSTTALTVRAFGPWAQLQARLPGTRQDVRSCNGRSNRGAKTLRSDAGVTRARLSQSRECTSRTGRSAGQHDARSRPGAECIVPPAGTALAPPLGVPSADRRPY